MNKKIAIAIQMEGFFKMEFYRKLASLYRDIKIGADMGHPSWVNIAKNEIRELCSKYLFREIHPLIEASDCNKLMFSVHYLNNYYYFTIKPDFEMDFVIELESVITKQYVDNNLVNLLARLMRQNVEIEVEDV